MKRHPSMQKFVDDFTEKHFGKSNTDAINEAVCVTCGNKVTGFKDALSQKEYGISGMCQECQDKTFGG